MKSRLCTLGLSLLLCLPAVAETPKPKPAPALKPAPAPPAAAYHWQKLAVSHIAPSAAFDALHQNTPEATAGIERVIIMQRDHTLLLHATDAGFAKATRLVQAVDK